MLSALRSKASYQWKLLWLLPPSTEEKTRRHNDVDEDIIWKEDYIFEILREMKKIWFQAETTYKPVYFHEAAAPEVTLLIRFVV